MTHIKGWLATSGELLVELRYPHGGSSGDFYLFATFADLTDMMTKARSGAMFFIYRLQQFPIRGIVDEVFINRALKEFPDREWYLITELDFTLLF
ncbi:MAG TPA: hypothetical protein VMT34_17980 [Aggregatilineales bacterium]|nr:hypothetical protein [Aggregatilineales bacterium]